MALLVGGGNAYVLAVTRDRRLGSVEDAPARPYAIVLGNRVFPGNGPCSELADRLAVARALYLSGRVSRLIVSGRVGPEPDYDEPAVMAVWLQARGVPAAAIVRDPGGYRTAASMADAAALGARQLLVVTQAYHLPRSVYLAAHAGIDAIGVPAPDHVGSLMHLLLREPMARAETVLEVWLRGVRGAVARR
ncbi:MAG TPA: ElyC/SanA/YdcF family protein [Polyangia bacterium]|nr:ElyC/SanA/YdcF family protein [Polyangia bacterium]